MPLAKQMRLVCTHCEMRCLRLCFLIIFDLASSATKVPNIFPFLICYVIELLASESSSPHILFVCRENLLTALLTLATLWYFLKSNSCFASSCIQLSVSCTCWEIGLSFFSKSGSIGKAMTSQQDFKLCWYLSCLYMCNLVSYLKLVWFYLTRSICESSGKKGMLGFRS